MMTPACRQSTLHIASSNDKRATRTCELLVSVLAAHKAVLHGSSDCCGSISLSQLACFPHTFGRFAKLLGEQLLGNAM